MTTTIGKMCQDKTTTKKQVKVLKSLAYDHITFRTYLTKTIVH